MFNSIHLRRLFSSYTYYPLILSPNYQPAEYSPSFMQDIKQLKIQKPNISQVNHERLPKFLAEQIQKDRQEFIKMKEVLFIGRSNVGKSSIINQIFGNKKIARAAKSPGTTKQLHFHQFKVRGESSILVDAPGYGFANMNKKRRNLWFGLMDEYMKISSRLCQIFHIINFQHGVKENDIIALNRISSYNVGIQLVLSKVDKVSKKNFMGQLKSINETIRRLQIGNINNRIIACSTKNSFGMDVLKCRLIQVLETAPQRNIDQHEHLLLDYLKQSRVSGVQMQKKHKQLSRPHVVRKLIYNSRLTKFLA